MAAPHQDAMPHIRFRLVARRDGEQPQTVDTEPTILQILLPSAPSPPKRKSAVSMRGSETAEYFCVAGNQLHKKNESVWATVQEDDSVRRLAQLLHAFFFVKENMFRSCFFYRPRMKSVQQVPHRLTVHMTSACCWELKSLMLIPSVWAEKRALLSAPILQGKGCVPEGLSNSHEKQSRRWAHGTRDQPFAAAGSSTSDSGTSNMRQELISPRAGKGRCWKVRRL